MRVNIICFTEQGLETLKRLKDGLAAPDREIYGYMKRPERNARLPRLPEGISLVEEPLKDWTGRRFETGSGLIFVGAVGIAVRVCASFLKGKSADPAVVVVDELGEFSISLLSGHLGGANDLTRAAASALGAVPVITTATDLNHKFAVDLFAKKNGLEITDLTAAKAVSAAVLSGEQIGFFCDFPMEGTLPAELVLGEEKDRNILVTVKTGKKPEKDCGKYLRLIPKAVSLGIGCRKGVSPEAVERSVFTALSENGIEPAAACSVSSIDLKKEEEGLTLFAEKMGLPFFTFSKEKLAKAEGDFTESDFVRSVTGVGNVCERAALAGCGEKGGQLIFGKTAAEGVTAAAACKNLVIQF